MEWKESIETPFGKIPDNWKVSRVKDEAMVVTDYVANGSFASLAENVQYKNEEDYAVLIRLVDYNNNFNGNFVFISKESYDFLGKSKLFGDEIIISNVGANVGTVFKCPHLKYKMSLAPNSVMVKFRGDNDFYYYWLKSNGGQGMLHSIVTGSAQPKFNKTNFREMVIPVPPLETQRRIAAILSSLDAKIENNNRINANLEAQAQALYKSWFVDFEPWGGVMPEDWKEVSLNDMTSKFGTGLNPRKNFKLGEGNNYYVTIKNMADNRVYLDDRCDKVTDEAIEKINKRSKLQAGDLLFSGIGTIGRVALVTETPTNWNTSESVFNLHPAKNISSEFLYVLLLSDVFQQYVKVYAQGGVQQGIRMASLKDYKMYIPNDNLLRQFDMEIIPIVSRIKNNEKENDNLAQLRDTLLPKLMKGEIAL
ncbi:MAG: restriction endonuclease subunit S [Paludibacteraceae bacterium]|nr:restriction endonuclease subunit S [Paludibacteraceae bacterium]